MKIRKDDQVEIISGDDKGTAENRRIAKVLRVLPEKNKIVVEGVNKVYKHLTPGGKNQQGGRLSTEMPIDASNVMLYCPACNRGVRVGHRFTEAGQKQRYCKSCKASLGNLGPPKEAHKVKAYALVGQAVGIGSKGINGSGRKTPIDYQWSPTPSYIPPRKLDSRSRRDRPVKAGSRGDREIKIKKHDHIETTPLDVPPQPNPSQRRGIMPSELFRKLVAEHPELSRALEAIDNYISTPGAEGFVDNLSVAAFASKAEIEPWKFTAAIALLVEAKLLHRSYEVLDRVEGRRAKERYDSIRQIPETVEDESGFEIDTKRAEIFPVYQGANQ